MNLQSYPLIRKSIIQVSISLVAHFQMSQECDSKPLSDYI